MQPLSQQPYAPKALKLGADALDSLGLEWWLSAGTLLGIYRENRLIPHDTDLDVGVMGTVEELADQIVEVFNGNDFRLFVKSRCQMAFYWEKAVFDIYFFQRKGDLVVCDTGSGWIEKPARLFDHLGKIWFEDSERMFPTPNPIADYLAVRYGPNWRIPREGKSVWTDDIACLRRYR